MLVVPKIHIKNTDDENFIIDAMQGLQLNKISCANWSELYPYQPDVSFKIAHNGEYLLLHFFVEEDEIKAEIMEDNGPVWQDSCVELFMSIGDSSYYYNAEFSCIGKMLMAYRPGREGAIRAKAEFLKNVKRYPSLGNQLISKQRGDFRWHLLLAIPASVYWESGLKTFDGIRARGNFYKCGDYLSTPHYLSWNPILTHKPNFHTPEYFGELYFE